jgi:hypothetical protein
MLWSNSTRGLSDQPLVEPSFLSHSPLRVSDTVPSTCRAPADQTGDVPDRALALRLHVSGIANLPQERRGVHVRRRLGCPKNIPPANGCAPCGSFRQPRDQTDGCPNRFQVFMNVTVYNSARCMVRDSAGDFFKCGRIENTRRRGVPQTVKTQSRYPVSFAAVTRSQKAVFNARLNHESLEGV